MPFNFQIHQLINVQIILFSFSVICVLVNNVNCHKCYVCGSEADAPTCDNFDPAEELYTKNCPEGTQSCSLHRYNGDVVQRSCESIMLNDCQVANGIKYCYCLQELCNGFEVVTEIIQRSMPTDDEDILEGSGANAKENEILYTSTTTTTTTEVTNQVNSGIMLRSCLAPVLATLLLY